MQINNNTISPNFTAIRIVNANNKQFQYFRKTHPDFMAKNHVFKAQSFNHSILLNTIAETAHNLGQKVTWMLANANNYGIVSLEKDFQTPMYVFTGFDKFKLKLLTLKDTLTSRKYYNKAAKLMLNGELPQHLVLLKALKYMADDKLLNFQKLLVKNKAKSISFSEFLNEVNAGKI